MTSTLFIVLKSQRLSYPLTYQCLEWRHDLQIPRSDHQFFQTRFVPEYIVYMFYVTDIPYIIADVTAICKLPTSFQTHIL